MFGLGKRERELKKVTHLWITASMMLLDARDIKSNPEKFKTTLAYFYGTALVGGDNLGLTKVNSREVYLSCLTRHLDFRSAKEIINARDTLEHISTQEKYKEIMHKGIDALEAWMDNKDQSAPMVLSAILMGIK